MNYLHSGIFTMTLALMGKKKLLNSEIVEQYVMSRAAAAEGQPHGECNKGGVTGRDRGGKKILSI